MESLETWKHIGKHILPTILYPRNNNSLPLPTFPFFFHSQLHKYTVFIQNVDHTKYSFILPFQIWYAHFPVLTIVLKHFSGGNFNFFKYFFPWWRKGWGLAFTLLEKCCWDGGDAWSCMAPATSIYGAVMGSQEPYPFSLATMGFADTRLSSIWGWVDPRNLTSILH